MNKFGLALPIVLAMLLLAVGSPIFLTRTVTQNSLTHYEQLITLGSREYEGGDISIFLDYPTYSYILLALPHGKVLNWRCEIIDGLYFNLSSSSTHTRIKGDALWERSGEKSQNDVICEMVSDFDVRGVRLLLLKANKYVKNESMSITVKSIKVEIDVEVSNPIEVRLVDIPWIEDFIVDREFFHQWYKPVQMDYPIVIANSSYRIFVDKIFHGIYPTFYVDSRDEAFELIEKLNPEIVVIVGVEPYIINITRSENIWNSKYNYTYSVLPYMRHGNNISQTLIFYIPPMSNEDFEKYVEKVYRYRRITHFGEWLVVAGSVDGIHPMSEVAAESIKHKLMESANVTLLVGANVSAFPSLIDEYDNVLLIMHGNPWKVGNPEVKSVEKITENARRYNVEFREFNFTDVPNDRPTTVLIALSCLTARWWENDTLSMKFLVDGSPILYVGWSMPVPVRHDYRLRYSYGFTFVYLAADSDLIEGLEKAIFYADLMASIRDDPNWNDMVNSLWLLGIPPT